MLAATVAARLRDISGADEDWIMRAAATDTPAAAHHLLARCLASTAGVEADLEQVRSLTLAQRDWLLLLLHQRSFGHDIVGEVRCPCCHDVTGIRFAARDVAPAPPAPGPVTVVLPSGTPVAVRPLTAGDHEYFASLGALDAEAQQHAAAARVVHPTRSDLTAEDREALAAAVEHSVPDPVRLDVACPACGQTLTVPFDPGRFLLAELSAHSRALIDDVHVLAMTYHWSEDDILKLPLKRRLAYLDRIDADRNRRIVRQEQP